jgi:hypothetical protein
MSRLRFRIRTLMIVVAIMAIVMGTAKVHVERGRGCPGIWINWGPVGISAWSAMGYYYAISLSWSLR